MAMRAARFRVLSVIPRAQATNATIPLHVPPSVTTAFTTGVVMTGVEIDSLGCEFLNPSTGIVFHDGVEYIVNLQPIRGVEEFTPTYRGPLTAQPGRAATPGATRGAAPLHASAGAAAHIGDLRSSRFRVLSVIPRAQASNASIPLHVPPSVTTAFTTGVVMTGVEIDSLGCEFLSPSTGVVLYRDEEYIVNFQRIR